MVLVGKILQKVAVLDHLISKNNNRVDGVTQQQRTLKKLLSKAKKTSFGKNYRFSEILLHKDPVSKFQKTVPIFDYEKLFDGWWIRTLNGEKNVTWPGKTKYFALTSGTSNDSSKRIPVTTDMIHSIRRIGFTQLKTLAFYDLPDEFYGTDMLMLGGSTRLVRVDKHWEGDLSGIITRTKPKWLNKFSKPAKNISSLKDWDEKLDKIVRQANKWDIGAVMGVPTWITILFEKIIEHYQVKSIHDVWPNLRFYAFGGVPIEPYLKTLERQTRIPLIYLNTYLASEGFLAYQRVINDQNSMKLALDNGIFFEFIQFNDQNFDVGGELRKDAKIITLEEVEEGVDYALLISTCAGAWRYMIGDTVRFVNKRTNEIVISGRTKHYLSLCGEHLSVDNMNQAIAYVSEDLNITIDEFTVYGRSHGNRYAHHWYLGCDEDADPEVIRAKLDDRLKVLNDDYATERKTVLTHIELEVLPLKLFYDWMAKNGKLGGQNKFPRVLKNDRLRDWQEFIADYRQQIPQDSYTD